MGKRSDFKRIEKDFYQTPFDAVEPLVRHLPEGSTFSEPCSGEGALINHLDIYGYTCIYENDISKGADALDYIAGDEDCIITNPPWSRPLLHAMIYHFCKQKPTWLLFDFDWAATKQAIPYLRWCKKIQVVKRLKWFPDSKHTGKDNCAWYLFDYNKDIPHDTIL